MHLLGIVGPDGGALADTVAARADGRVATVESLPGPAPAVDAGPTPDRAPAARSSYGLADDSWIGAGEGGDLDALLDDLAPAHDYAVLVGFPDAAVPTVALGDAAGADAAGDVIAAAPTPEEVDVDAVLAAVDDAEPHVTLETLVERATRADGAEFAGAVATFTGRVRARDGPDDDPTTHLTFDSYESVAAERLATIRAELCEREGVHEVLMHHRTGRIEAGEDIVFVVVLAGHREEAFRTVSDGIDRLKEEVPIFKKESTETEEFWVHDRADADP
jgi:molybdopterin synthase catalytic subunit